MVKATKTHVLLAQLVIYDDAWYCPFRRARDESRAAQVLQLVFSPIWLVLEVVGGILKRV